MEEGVNCAACSGAHRGHTCGRAKIRSKPPLLPGGHAQWTDEEDIALAEAVFEHGEDFDRIKAESGTTFGERTAGALSRRFWAFTNTAQRQTTALKATTNLNDSISASTPPDSSSKADWTISERMKDSELEKFKKRLSQNTAVSNSPRPPRPVASSKDTTRTTTEEEEQQLKVTPMRVTVQEEEEEEEQQPKITTTKLASTPLKGAATRVTVQEQDNDEPTTTNLSAAKTNLTGIPLRFKQLPSASTENTPAALAFTPPKGPATHVAITTAAATTTTSERTPLNELVNVEVEGQDRTAKISLRDNVNSSQDLEEAFLTNDLEKIVAEEEGCAKFVDIMVDHVNEARTVNSLVLPSTWLLDDDGSTLISPNGKRYPKYIQQQQQSNLMSEIKKSYRDDYAKMVAHAHDNIGIGNGNGFRLATAEEKDFCTTSHRTNPDPDFVVKAYPDDWKVVVNVKVSSRLLALTPQGEVFDTKKKAVAKLVEMQKQQAMERGECQPKVKRKSQLGIPNPFSPVKRAKRVVKHTPQYSQFMCDDEEGKGREKKTKEEEEEVEIIDIDSEDDSVKDEEDEEEEAREKTRFSVGAVVLVAPSKRKQGRKMEAYVGTIFRMGKNGDFTIKPVNKWQGRGKNRKPMLKAYCGIKEERLSPYDESADLTKDRGGDNKEIVPKAPEAKEELGWFEAQLAQAGVDMGREVRVGRARLEPLRDRAIVRVRHPNQGVPNAKLQKEPNPLVSGQIVDVLYEGEKFEAEIVSYMEKGDEYEVYFFVDQTTSSVPASDVFAIEEEDEEEDEGSPEPNATITTVEDDTDEKDDMHESRIKEQKSPKIEHFLLVRDDAPLLRTPRAPQRKPAMIGNSNKLFEDDTDEDEDEDELEAEVVTTKKRKRKETTHSVTHTDGRGGHKRWTEEEDAALAEAIDDYGRMVDDYDFDRLKAESGNTFGERTAQALKVRVWTITKAKRYKNLEDDTDEDDIDMQLEANPTKRTDLWTAEEDEALKRGVLKHGNSWKKILETENEILGRRTWQALEGKYRNESRELMGPIPTKVIRWTEEEDEALRRGVLSGNTWKNILETENEVLGRRSVGGLSAKAQLIKIVKPKVVALKKIPRVVALNKKKFGLGFCKTYDNKRDALGIFCDLCYEVETGEKIDQRFSVEHETTGDTPDASAATPSAAVNPPPPPPPEGWMCSFALSWDTQNSAWTPKNAVPPPQGWNFGNELRFEMGNDDVMNEAAFNDAVMNNVVVTSKRLFPTTVPTMGSYAHSWNTQKSSRTPPELLGPTTRVKKKKKKKKEKETVFLSNSSFPVWLKTRKKQWQEKRLEKRGIAIALAPEVTTKSWTAQQETALVVGVAAFKLDFTRIKAEYSPLFNRHTLRQLETQYGKSHTDELSALRTAAAGALIPFHAPWTVEESAALFEGLNTHGLDFDQIKADNEDLFKARSTDQMDRQASTVYPDKCSALRKELYKGNSITVAGDLQIAEGINVRHETHGEGVITVVMTSKSLKGKFNGEEKSIRTRQLMSIEGVAVAVTEHMPAPGFPEGWTVNIR